MPVYRLNKQTRSRAPLHRLRRFSVPSLISRAILLLVALLLPSILAADVLYLRNGKVLNGRVYSYDGRVVIFQIPGQKKARFFPRSQVKRLVYSGRGARARRDRVARAARKKATRRKSTRVRVVRRKKPGRRTASRRTTRKATRKTARKTSKKTTAKTSTAGSKRAGTTKTAGKTTTGGGGTRNTGVTTAGGNRRRTAAEIAAGKTATAGGTRTSSVTTAGGNRRRTAAEIAAGKTATAGGTRTSSVTTAGGNRRRTAAEIAAGKTATAGGTRTSSVTTAGGNRRRTAAEIAAGKTATAGGTRTSSVTTAGGNRRRTAAEIAAGKTATAGGTRTSSVTTAGGNRRRTAAEIAAGKTATAGGTRTSSVTTAGGNRRRTAAEIAAGKTATAGGTRRAGDPSTGRGDEKRTTKAGKTVTGGGGASKAGEAPRKTIPRDYKFDQRRNTLLVVPGDAQITLAAGDALSPPVRIYYALNGAPYQQYRAPVDLPRDGHYTIRFYAVDSAGNREAPRLVHVLADGTAPVITIETGPRSITRGTRIYSRDGIVFVRAADEHSGVTNLSCSVNGEKTQPGKGGGIVLKAKRNLITCEATDQVDNRSRSAPYEVVIDKTGPEISWRKNTDGTGTAGQPYLSRRPLNFHALDTGAGIAELYLLVDGKAVKLSPQARSIDALKYASGSRNTELRLRAVDALGNTNASGPLFVRTDRRAPRTRIEVLR